MSEFVHGQLHDFLSWHAKITDPMPSPVLGFHAWKLGDLTYFQGAFPSRTAGRSFRESFLDDYRDAPEPGVP